jgi:L-2-hydroxycarboxylate dehydrogenase (NAD+)
MTEFVLVPADKLRDFAAKTLMAAGVPEDLACDAADVLVWANLRGVDTHGIRNLKLIYTRQIREGRINPTARCTIEYETPVTARVNANSGLGLSSAVWGMRLAMEKARQSGVGLVTMHNSWHFGAAGYYPWMALQQDMIGIALTGSFWGKGSEIGVMPTFSTAGMFSTNPISVSFPAGNEVPFLLDMATSIYPYNRVAMFRELGRTLPEGIGVDANGQPTTDPTTLKRLYPLGGMRETGGHKGYGLAMMVEVLCAVLSGGWGPDTDNDPRAFDGYAQKNDSHFFAAIRVDAFRPLEDFKAGMDAMIRSLHAAPTEEGRERVYIAGEPELETLKKRSVEGIPLPPAVVTYLQEVSQQYNVPLDL